MSRIFIISILALSVACAPDADRSLPAVTESYAVTPDGVNLYYRVAGSGSDTVIAPFALYHEDALDAIAVGRRIVTYDPRGRGRSDAAPLDRISLDYLLDDFETIRRAVGAEKVAIIGWSGAGMEMFVYALRHPDNVTRLVQLAPVAARIEPYGGMMMEDRARRTDADAMAELQKRYDGGEFEDDPAAYCREFDRITTPASFADPGAMPPTPDVCGYENEYPGNTRTYFGKLFESIAGYDWREALPKVSIPRLLIHGEKDNIPYEGNVEWVRGQRNARLLLIEDAGHWPHYEQPDVTLRAIDQFLDGNWPRAAVAIP